MRYRRAIQRPVSREMPAAGDHIRMMKPAVASTCPGCDGMRVVMMQLPGRPDTARPFKCVTCDGKGEVIE